MPNSQHSSVAKGRGMEKRMRKIKRSRRWDKHGVSELLGSILILAITVALFTTLFIFIQNLEGPTGQTYTNFNSSMEFDDANGNDGLDLGEQVWINITHDGGEGMKDWFTEIFLIQFNNSTMLWLNSSLIDVGEEWTIGETWSYSTNTLVGGEDITIWVRDNEKNTIVWRNILLASAGNFAPIIKDRWIDSNWGTIAHDEVFVGDSLSIFVKVSDPDDDLDPDQVNIECTAFGFVPLKMYDDGTTGDRVADDGIFSRNVSSDAQLSWNGATVKFTAVDDTGLTAVARMSLRIRQLTTYINQTTINEGGNYTEPTFGGNNTVEFTLNQGFGFQRFDIFNATQWDTVGWGSTPTRHFKRGEGVVVVVASKYLANVFEKNDFYVYNPLSGIPGDSVVYGGGTPDGDTKPTRVSTPDTLTTDEGAFDFIDYINGYYVYVFRFNTSSDPNINEPLIYGAYPVEIDLKTTVVSPPDNRFQTLDKIYITDDNGDYTEAPDLQTFRDAAHTIPADHFNFTETIYCKVVVKSAEASATWGDVIIRDFLGGLQVQDNAEGAVPCSNAGQNDSTSYSFEIQLPYANGPDPWSVGIHSYALEVVLLEDSNEVYKSVLSTQLTIVGPRWFMDIGTSVFEEAAQTHGGKYYGHFFENRKDWNMYTYEEYNAAPGSKDPSWGSFKDVCFGDIDGDSDLDMIVAASSDTNGGPGQEGFVFYYRNLVGDGEIWIRYTIDSGLGDVLSVAVGHGDDDDDLDIVAGDSIGNIYYYENTGEWVQSAVGSLGADINALKMADVTGDNVDDIIAACEDGKVYVFQNDGSGQFGSSITTYYDVVSEVTDVGAISAGSFADTTASDDGYEVVQEAILGPAAAYSDDEAIAETPGYNEGIIGSFVDTQIRDSTFERILEDLPAAAEPEVLCAAFSLILGSESNTHTATHALGGPSHDIDEVAPGASTIITNADGGDENIITGAPGGNVIDTQILSEGLWYTVAETDTASADDLTLTTSNVDTTGTTTNFANAQSDSDAGAFATLAEEDTGSGGGSADYYATGSVNSGWTDPGNVEGTADAAVATLFAEAANVGDYVEGRSYPTGSGSINTVEVKIRYKVSGTVNQNLDDIDVQLYYKISGAVGATSTTFNANGNTAFTTVTVDVSADRAWTWADITNMNIGAELNSYTPQANPGKADSITIEVDSLWTTITTAAASVYEMEIELATSGVPAGDSYDLELYYQISDGDSFDVLAYNGATWDTLGSMSSAAWATWTSGLTAAQYNGGNVRIKFMDTASDGSQSDLQIDYLRIRTGYTDVYNTEMTFDLGEDDGTPTVWDSSSYTLKLTARCAGGSAAETFTVQYSTNSGSTWSPWGTINDFNWVTLPNQAVVPSAGQTVMVRIFDANGDDANPHGIEIDYLELTGETTSEYDLDARYTFTLSEEPGADFTFNTYSRFIDADSETMSIWAYDYDIDGAWEDTGVDVSSAVGYGWASATLGPEYCEDGTHNVQIRYKADTLTGDTVNIGALSVDYHNVSTTGEGTSRLEHTWQITIPGGDHVTVYLNAYHSVDADGEDYDFEYSTTGVFGGEEVSMFTLTNTTADSYYHTYTDATLDAYTGTVWIRAIDTDRTMGNYNGSTLYVDHLYINSTTDAQQYSQFNHTWEIDTTGAGGGSSTYRLLMEAYHPADPEYEDFNIWYSTDGGTAWTSAYSITKTGDNDLTQPVVLPAVTNQLLVRALDTDQGIGNTSLSSIYVDWLTLRKVEIVPDSVEIDMGSPVNDISIGDIDEDGDLDIVAGTDDRVWVLWNEGEGTADLPGDQGDSFTTTSVASPGTVAALDIGNVDENDQSSNATLDIVVAVGNTVTYYANDGSWTANAVDTMTNDIADLEVGDINGDFWDDIVFCYGAADTAPAFDEILFYYQNDRYLGTWTDHAIIVKDFADLKSHIWYAVALGDVDRGIVE